jgi:hypothetical protein
MALSESVSNSLKDAESSLRNALAYAARGERPMVCNQIAKMIGDISHIADFDGMLDTIDNHLEELKDKD